MEDHPRDGSPPHPARGPGDLRSATRRALTLAAALSIGGAAAAIGAPGDPAFRSCVSNSGTHGCEALPAGSLAGASALALSPDGHNLYVSSYGADAVSVFARTGRGGLRFAGCVGDPAAAPGCAPAPDGALGGAGGVAVSPSGADVYVASGLGRSVSRLARGPDGALSFAGCVAADGRHGCADPEHDSLVGADGIALGPGGSDLYVTSVDGAAVSHLTRGADGSLTVADCVADGGGFGCASPPGNVLEGAAGIALSAKGGDVYVASVASSSISHLRRTAGGGLAYRDCRADGGANGCAKVPEGTLLGATGVAIAPDGASVYVASAGGVVSRFARKRSSGRLKLTGCIGDDGPGGCAAPKGARLSGASGIAVSPGGHDVYVAAGQGRSIARLRATGRGGLRFGSCVAHRRHRCSGAPTPALRGAYALALRGRSLYAVAPQSASLARLQLARRGG